MAGSSRKKWQDSRRTTQTFLARRVEVAADLLGIAFAVAALLVLALALAAVLPFLLGRVDDVLLVRILALVAVSSVARVAHLEAGHRLAVDLALVTRACALAGALLTCRENRAGSRSRREDLEELVLLSLVPTVLDKPSSHVYQKVEASGVVPVLQAVPVSHRSTQAGELLEPSHQSAVEVRLRGLRFEREHEGVPRVHQAPPGARSCR